MVLHAVTNAISGITGVNILGDIADSMCQQGITDSKEYLKEALKYLDWEIVNLSISIECKIPKISPRIKEMKLSIASLLNISENRIGITATLRRPYRIRARPWYSGFLYTYRKTIIVLTDISSFISMNTLNTKFIYGKMIASFIIQFKNSAILHNRQNLYHNSKPALSLQKCLLQI